MAAPSLPIDRDGRAKRFVRGWLATRASLPSRSAVCSCGGCGMRPLYPNRAPIVYDERRSSGIPSDQDTIVRQGYARLMLWIHMILV